MTTPVSPAPTAQASSDDLGARFPTLSPLRPVPTSKAGLSPKRISSKSRPRSAMNLAMTCLPPSPAWITFLKTKWKWSITPTKRPAVPGLEFKVQVPREDPVEVPSLINVWPGVDFQEREAWDLLGIRFTGSS